MDYKAKNITIWPFTENLLIPDPLLFFFKACHQGTKIDGARVCFTGVRPLQLDTAS